MALLRRSTSLRMYCRKILPCFSTSICGQLKTDPDPCCFNSIKLSTRPIHNSCNEVLDKKKGIQKNPDSRFLHTLNTHNQQTSDGDHQDPALLTHFGYQEIEESEKVKKVYEVFENVAGSYDLMNDAMSAGTHRLWKSKFVEQLNVRPRMKILDMAGGTGDIAFKMFDSYALQYPNHSNELYPDIVISDINQNMLDVGKERANKLGINHLFQWVQADAEELPFEDESFDVYTIAFGIRNTTHIEKVLDEAFRVLKIGGRFSCLEFSHVENVVVSDLYDAYSFQVIPVMGEVLANDWDSYQYLVESIRRFPKQDDFAEMIYETGFSNVRYENMTFGVVAVHDGFKI